VRSHYLSYFSFLKFPFYDTWFCMIYCLGNNPSWWQIIHRLRWDCYILTCCKYIGIHIRRLWGIWTCFIWRFYLGHVQHRIIRAHQDWTVKFSIHHLSCLVLVSRQLLSSCKSVECFILDFLDRLSYDWLGCITVISFPFWSHPHFDWWSALMKVFV
jgi:hypothetical protein